MHHHLRKKTKIIFQIKKLLIVKLNLIHKKKIELLVLHIKRLNHNKQQVDIVIINILKRINLNQKDNIVNQNIYIKILILNFYFKDNHLKMMNLQLIEC